MIFARRSIQRFLDGLSGVLTREAVSSIIEKLNRKERASLDFEWEVAVLFALSRLGKIAYEADHGGTRRPDLTFLETGSPTIAFVADIATVSDRGLADENPVDDLSEFLRKKAQKLGLPGTFDYQIAGAAAGNRYADRKMKLAMGTRQRLDIHDDMIKKLREMGLNTTQLEEADRGWRQGMNILFGRVFDELFDERAAAKGLVIEERTNWQSNLIPSSGSIPGRLRRLKNTGSFSGRRICSIPRFEEWFEDYKHFKSSGDLRRREDFLELAYERVRRRLARR